MTYDYEKWKSRLSLCSNPDLECLSDLLFATKQYLQSPRAKIARVVLDQAISLTERWVEDRNSDTEVNNVVS